MKKLDTSPISTSIAFPVKSGTLQHIQSAYQEALAQTTIAQIGVGYDATKCYILYGLVNSGTAPAYSITSGAVFFSGEVYLVDTASGTLTGSNVVTGVITNTFFVAANADPVTFTDGVIRNVHQIRKVTLQPGLAGSGIADYNNFRVINPSNIGVGEVKMYVGSSTDFDSTGLGIAANVRGWARCNGNHGTFNIQGRIPICRDIADSDFDTIGNERGSKTHTNTLGELVSHTHTFSAIDGKDDFGGVGYPITSSDPSTGGSTDLHATIGSAGSGTPYSIMNPVFTVDLIQRIY